MGMAEISLIEIEERAVQRMQEIRDSLKTARNETSEIVYVPKRYPMILLAFTSFEGEQFTQHPVDNGVLGLALETLERSEKVIVDLELTSKDTSAEGKIRQVRAERHSQFEKFQ